MSEIILKSNQIKKNMLCREWWRARQGKGQGSSVHDLKILSIVLLWFASNELDFQGGCQTQESTESWTLLKHHAAAISAPNGLGMGVGLGCGDGHNYSLSDFLSLQMNLSMTKQNDQCAQQTQISLRIFVFYR